MRTLRLRTLLVLLTVSLSLLIFTAALVSYTLRKRAHQTLQTTIDTNLLALARLPEMRGLLRQLDEFSDSYILTGSSQWLTQWSKAEQKARKLLKSFYLPIGSGLPSDLRDSINENFDELIEFQNQNHLKFSRDRPDAPTVHLWVQDDEILNGLIEQLSIIKDQSINEIQNKRVSTQLTSLLTFIFIALLGILTALGASFYISKLIVSPVTALAKLSSDYEFDKSWNPLETANSAELTLLSQNLSNMVKRLSTEFNREKELNDLKSNLVSMVSHEFGNTVNVISGAAFVLEKLDEDGDAAKKKGFYKMLHSSASSLAMVSQNLLNLARLESGKFALNVLDFDIRETITECREVLIFFSQRKNIRLTTHLPDKPVRVRADKETIHLVMTNLLNNAIKYTPDGGNVEMGVIVPPPGEFSVIVYIKDTGIGISQKDQEKIFGGFYRTEEGRAAAKGFGVGLSLVKKILEAHNTTIALESEPGRGTRFSFRLPVSQNP